MNGFDLKDITNIVPTTTDFLISIEILPRGCTKFICLRFEQNFLITNSFNHLFNISKIERLLQKYIRLSCTKASIIPH